LELHKAKVEYYEKMVECVDDNGIVRSTQVENILMKTRQIISMHVKHNMHKGCKGHLIHITKVAKETRMVAEQPPIIKEILNVLLDEFPWLPPT
jgi:hypothetical protein